MVHQISLPNHNLFDLMVILSFYKTCPGCVINFNPVNMEGTITFDEDIIKRLNESLVQFQKEIQRGRLFNIQFVSDQEWEYDPESFSKSDACRAYAHEFKEVIPKKKKKEDEKLMKRCYGTSPLVLLERRDSYLYIEKNKLAGKLFRCQKYLNLRRVIDMIFKVPNTGQDIEKIKSEDITDGNGDKSLGCGWNPHAISNNANVVNTVSDHGPIKTMMAIIALGLFETYLNGRRITTDGYHHKHFLVPLSRNPLRMEVFQSWQRHPKIWCHWENKEFWHAQGLVDCYAFTLRRVNTLGKKYGIYYENRRA